MKKYFKSGLLLLFSVLLNLNISNAAVTNSVVYKLSVNIPAHVQPSPIMEQSSSQTNTKISSPESDQQTIIEQQQRGQEIVTLQTITLK